MIARWWWWWWWWWVCYNVYSTTNFNPYMYSGCIRQSTVPVYIMTSDYLKDISELASGRSIQVGWRKWVQVMQHIQLGFFIPWRWKQYYPHKRLALTHRLHGVINWNSKIWNSCEIFHVTSYLKPEHYKFLTCQIIHSFIHLFHISLIFTDVELVMYTFSIVDKTIINHLLRLG